MSTFVWFWWRDRHRVYLHFSCRFQRAVLAALRDTGFDHRLGIVVFLRERKRAIGEHVCYYCNGFNNFVRTRNHRILIVEKILQTFVFTICGDESKFDDDSAKIWPQDRFPHSYLADLTIAISYMPAYIAADDSFPAWNPKCDSKTHQVTCCTWSRHIISPSASLTADKASSDVQALLVNTCRARKPISRLQCRSADIDNLMIALPARDRLRSATGNRATCCRPVVSSVRRPLSLVLARQHGTINSSPPRQ